MELKQAIRLIDTPHLQKQTPQTWADLGSGAGLFTKALASQLAPGSTIIAMDTDNSSLQKIEAHPTVTITKQKANFIQEAPALTSLDGILMANSLHYVQQQLAFLNSLKKAFKEQPRFIIIEYNTDNGNQWVPYPLSYNSLKQLFNKAGYNTIEKIAQAPSVYNNNHIYSAWITV